ncbi:hypothetical protein PSACC_02828, partial [Paramicrosporidium saccamoebae]
STHSLPLIHLPGLSLIQMPVRIRLARIGCRHDPHYRINVANSWAKRDGRHIEKLGEYHAQPDQSGVKRISLDFARTKYWLSVGAQPTDTVARLLGKVKLIECIDICRPESFLPFREAPAMEEKESTGDGTARNNEFGQHIVVKQENLGPRQAEGLAQRGKIFSGIVAQVNGPPQHELEDMIVQHGGRFEQYHASPVTHMIATTPSDTEIGQLQLERLVVKPQWITDSIRDKRLLPVDEYQLCAQAHNKNPSTLSVVKATNKIDVTKNENENENGSENENETCRFSDDFVAENETCRFSDDSVIEDETRRSYDDFVAENETCRPSLEEAWHSDIADSEIGTGNPIHHLRLTDANDPNFLEHYFAASRLHHLSTWREDLKLFAQSLMRKRKKKLHSGPRVLFHVDMDCFFASVSLRDRQDLVAKPVAITHAANRQDGAMKLKDSSSDLASCNYAAREFGLRNGMYIKTALQLCPSLTLLPYEYEKYQQVSYELYRILANYADELQAVSCDEVFIDVSSAFPNDPSTVVDPSNLAEEIRKVIYQKLGCNASIGIGSNLLLARLATKKAKPNGQFYLKEDMVSEYFQTLPLSNIPGVGWSIERRLSENGWKTCGDLLSVPLSRLRELFGPKQGSTLYERARGIDNRLISESKPRQSVGADITWGVRFETRDQLYDFVNRLSVHVFSKLEVARLVSYKVQFRLLRRTPGAGEPIKRLGHGECDAFSKTRRLGGGITSAMALQEACRVLCNSLSIPPGEIRGVGIFLSDLAEKEPGPKQTSVLSLMEQGQVDPIERVLKMLGYSQDVFDELSEELRQEIISEATMKRHAEISPTKQCQPPAKQRKLPVKLSAVKRETKMAKTSIIDMLASRPSAPTGVPQEIDQTVFDALPEEIQNELREHYRLAKPMTHELLTAPIADCIPGFCGMHNIEEIHKWFSKRLQDEPAAVVKVDILDLTEYAIQLVSLGGFTEYVRVVFRYIVAIPKENVHLLPTVQLAVDKLQNAFKSAYGTSISLE